MRGCPKQVLGPQRYCRSDPRHSCEAPNPSAPQIPSPRMAPFVFKAPEPLNPIFPAQIMPLPIPISKPTQETWRKAAQAPTHSSTYSSTYTTGVCSLSELTVTKPPTRASRDKATYILPGDRLESAFHHRQDLQRIASASEPLKDSSLRQDTVHTSF